MLSDHLKARLRWRDAGQGSARLRGIRGPSDMGAQFLWTGHEWVVPSGATGRPLPGGELSEFAIGRLARQYNVPLGIVPIEFLHYHDPERLTSLSAAVIELGGETRLRGFLDLLKQTGISVEAYVGGGGWGHVFRAQRTDLMGPIAIKVLKPPYNEEWRKRFERESAILIRLCECPAVVRLAAEPAELDGLLFLQMELVDGRPLSDLLLPLGESDTLAVIREILFGLAPVHRSGVVHRDLHLGNVMIESSGRLVILDFGLAKDENDLLYSRTFKPVGAMSHCALEKWRAPSEAGPASDIFSVGVMFYKLVTAEMPFRGTTYIDLYERIREGSFRKPSEARPDINWLTDRLVERLLAREASERPSDAEEALALVRSYGVQRPQVWYERD